MPHPVVVVERISRTLRNVRTGETERSASLLVAQRRDSILEAGTVEMGKSGEAVVALALAVVVGIPAVAVEALHPREAGAVALVVGEEAMTDAASGNSSARVAVTAVE